MSKKLVVSDGTRERELQLVGRIVLGRDPGCDITLDHSLLSRRHAEFVTAGDLVVVRDLGSRNGVLVNGIRTAEQTLQPGDIVQIGPLRAEYVLDDVPLSITPEDHDAERTAVFVSPPTSVPSASVPPYGESDDEQATRLISARHSVEARPEAGEVSARPITTGGGDSDVTRFMPSPSPDVPPSAAAANEPGRSRRSGASMRTFVFLQLLVLGGLVLAAAAVSFSIEGIATPITSLVVPIVVAVVAGYLVSGVIDRRFVGVLGDTRDRDWGG